MRTSAERTYSIPSFLRRLAAPFLLILLAACGDEPSEQGQAGGQGGGPPPQVAVMTTERQDIEVHTDYAGRVRGAREVEVRARVEGILQKRLYEEGEVVEEGKSLFAIDPEPFALSLQAARAERNRVEAELQQAEREWRRVSRLYEQNAISERERDSALSTLELARASLALANAEVDQARLELDYTDVAAPAPGVTSLEVLPEGSLVERGSLLTTITQLDPVHVRFALPESDAALQRQAREAMGRSGNGETRRDATLILPEGEEYERTGEIDFTASTINPQTGTVLARAIFPNPEHTIVPGQFVRVRLLLRTLEDAVSVPEVAVGEGPESAQVFVVDEENVVHARQVTLGPVVEGKQVITEGLEAGEQVIVNGQVAVQDGMTVQPQQAQEDNGDETGDAQQEASTEEAN